jgi:hypothetical protein
MIYMAVSDLGLKELSKLNELEIFTTIISGAAHDIDHPGTNNVFEIKCKSKLALLYNDQSVLENHHAASFFFLVDNTSNNCDIMQFLSPEESTQVRKAVIENILGTDMTKHGQIMKDLQEITSMSPEEQSWDDKNKALLLKAVVHAVDISNPTREFKVAEFWSKKIVAEFFYQGDRERVLGLDITMMCDRHTSNFASGQIGFINFMIMPYFSLMAKILPKWGYAPDTCAKNLDIYKGLVEQYEEDKKNGNPEL